MISSLTIPKSSAYKTVFGFNSKTAGVQPNLGVAFCEEKGLLLRLRQKSQGFSSLSIGSIQSIEAHRHSYKSFFNK